MTPTRLRTTIAGSLPKPAWLAEPAKLWAPWRLEGDALAEGKRDAVRLVLRDQERAGIDIVTDGEQTRRHFVTTFIEQLDGVDFANRKTVRIRNRYDADVPVVTGAVARRGPVFVDDARFLRQATSRQVKVTLPGPMTIADEVADEHYHTDQKTLAMRFARILNAEARALADAGADVIQFDEPCFNIHLDDVRAWGVEALEQCMDGVKAVKAVHICYGYGTPLVIAWKSQNTDWGHYGVTLPLLARSSVDQVSVECAASGVDMSVLRELGDKEVLVGVIDVCTDAVESPELVAGRIRGALQHVPAARLMPCTDCGLVPRSRESARGKMHALAAGAALVRTELKDPVSLTVARYL